MEPTWQMTTTDRAIDFVLSNEGGYVCHPDDPGGETNFGISKRSYPHEDIKHLSSARAREIYERDYWLPIRGPELPEQVAVPLLDYAVNAGVVKAIRALQAMLRVKRDGRFGPITIDALRQRVSDKGALRLAEELILERAVFLVKLGCRRHGSEVFLTGWMRRIRDNLRYVRSYKG
jgi:lysozyme family protein